jgi:alpha-1,3-mannosyltransferase
MKVVHFTNRYWPAIGGVEDVVDNLCEQLQKKDIISDVITLNRLEGKKLKKKEINKNTKIFRLPYLDLKYYKLSTLPFSVLKNYDIIHIHSLGFFSDMILLTKFIHKKKIIISTHGGIFHTQNISGIKKFYFHIIQKFLLKNADKIIAVSKQDKKKFEEISNNVTLIENGFNAQEPKGNKEKNTFLFVGRISKNKNVEKLIELFSQLKIDYKLTLVGRDFDNLIPKLTKKIKDNDLGEKIKIIPGATNPTLAKLYSASEYFVSASKYEGFGITAIESMHYNCKSILNIIPTYIDFASNGRGHTINFEGDTAHKELAKAISSKYDLKKAKTYADSFLWKKKIGEFVKLYGSLF